MYNVHIIMGLLGSFEFWPNAIALICNDAMCCYNCFEMLIVLNHARKMGGDMSGIAIGCWPVLVPSFKGFIASSLTSASLSMRVSKHHLKHHVGWHWMFSFDYVFTFKDDMALMICACLRFPGITMAYPGLPFYCNCRDLYVEWLWNWLINWLPKISWYSNITSWLWIVDLRYFVFWFDGLCLPKALLAYQH